MVTQKSCSVSQTIQELNSKLLKKKTLFDHTLLLLVEDEQPHFVLLAYDEDTAAPTCKESQTSNWEVRAQKCLKSVSFILVKTSKVSSGCMTLTNITNCFRRWRTAVQYCTMVCCRLGARRSHFSGLWILPEDFLYWVFLLNAWDFSMFSILSSRPKTCDSKSEDALDFFVLGCFDRRG